MSPTLLGTLQMFGCLLAADFISGVVHWVEDTYARPGIHPLLDEWIVEPNIWHHQSPASIISGTYWESTRVSVILAAGAALLFWLCGVRAWEAYFIVALTSQANYVHKLSHKRQKQPVVRALQALGLMQSVWHHAQHHRPPYAIRYCVMTNYLNPVLESLNFWRRLESAIYVVFGLPVARGTEQRDGY